MVRVLIDDREFEAPQGSSILQVAKAQGIEIPTLCYHPALKPSGSCKLCVVEVPGKAGRPVTMLSCILRVREGLSVKTQSELVLRTRTRALKNLLVMAPQSKALLDLAERFEVDVGPPPDGCVRCRLCIRVCKEIVEAGALKMEKRDGRNYVVPLEGRCIGCGTCVNLCPTDAIRLEDKDGVRTISIRDEIIGIHALERCDACGKLFATRKFLERAASRATTMHPDVKEHHLYCPTCAKLFSNRVKTFSRPRR